MPTVLNLHIVVEDNLYYDVVKPAKDDNSLTRLMNGLLRTYNDVPAFRDYVDGSNAGVDMSKTLEDVLSSLSDASSALRDASLASSSADDVLGRLSDMASGNTVTVPAPAPTVDMVQGLSEVTPIPVSSTPAQSAPTQPAQSATVPVSPEPVSDSLSDDDGLGDVDDILSAFAEAQSAESDQPAESVEDSIDVDSIFANAMSSLDF